MAFFYRATPTRVGRVALTPLPVTLPVKGDVEGTDVSFVTRLSVLHMGLLIIDSMIDAQFLMKS